MPKINELPAATALTATDVLAMDNTSGTATKKVTGRQIKDFVTADVNAEVTDLKNAVTNLENAIYDDRSIGIGTLSGGRYSTSGYQSIGSSKWVYSHEFPAGTYTFTPPNTWNIGYYYYDSDSAGTQIYADNNNSRTFTAVRPFIASGRKVSNTDYTSEELASLEANFEVIKYAEEDNNLTARVTALENNTLTTADFNAKFDSLPSWESWNAEYEHVKGYDYNDLLAIATSLDVRNSSEVAFNDYVKFRGAPFSIRQKTNSSNSQSEIRMTVNTPFTLAGTQEIEVYLYTEDADKISEVRLATIGSGMDKTLTTTLQNGWNRLRFFTEGAGYWDVTTDTTVIRFLVYTTYSIDVWIGAIYQVKPPKANMIVIADGPYLSFYEEAYPLLTAAGIPVTWAIDPGFITDSTASDRELINNTELEALASDGLSEFSFHSYDGTIMSSASASQALADTVKSIRYLRKKGLEPNHIWRAAWLQNSCADPSLANQELEASATYTGTNMVTVYPFVDKYNIPRMAMANRTTSFVDDLFMKMAKEHCTILFYAHGISTTTDKDITPTLLQYYIDKMAAGISAGYINPITYSRLVTQFPIKR